MSFLLSHKVDEECETSSYKQRQYSERTDRSRSHKRGNQRESDYDHRGQAYGYSTHDHQDYGKQVLAINSPSKTTIYTQAVEREDTPQVNYHTFL